MLSGYSEIQMIYRIVQENNFAAEDIRLIPERQVRFWAARDYVTPKM